MCVCACTCVIQIQCGKFVRLQPGQFRELEQLLGRGQAERKWAPLVWLTKFRHYLGLHLCEFPLFFDSCVTPTFYGVASLEEMRAGIELCNGNGILQYHYLARCTE